MSETYSVWHGTTDGDDRRCYVTAINVQELGQGDDQFVAQLLGSLGHADAEVSGWRIGEPFAVDHLSSGEAEDWRDVWLLTWPLTLSGPALPDLPDEPVDVTAWDESWTGKEAEPRHLEVVATRGDDARELDPDLGGTTCPLGHAHIEVPVDGDPTGAARLAAEIEERCRDAGWSTSYLDSVAD